MTGPRVVSVSGPGVDREFPLAAGLDEAATINVARSAAITYACRRDPAPATFYVRDASGCTRWIVERDDHSHVTVSKGPQA